ncbi:PQQ-binding-like beta-propeller repeat protein [Spirosoma sp. HMF4905]|uniref:PQQ-binding-like beta-propeller repeat protein n=1 Tax=Spirosoma arboris TaxID=2682092 RepID=A0A7K1SMM6_9BACT|nr:PQQ-binding-like beta-propeller repeat protein [Spirosoma arboris]MVM35049.1 PQQ-binding-like beta-propeller repeat protein [Spirosoma arboris]
MKKQRRFRPILFGAFPLVMALLFTGCSTDENKERTWSVYKADENSSSYSPLDQINASNVGQLKPAWTFAIHDAPKGSTAGAVKPQVASTGNSQCNPIIVDGVLYATSSKQWAYAVDAATGKEIWSFDPFNGADRGNISRGVTYWETRDGGPDSDKRILFTAADRLIALDARTGKPIESFGEQGKVNLNVGLRGDPNAITVTPTSPGIVYKDLLILGSRIPDTYDEQPGFVRAYDCKTGKLVWTFHTIPQPGEPGYETWPKDAYKSVGGVNNWAGLSLDSKRGLVYLALGSPTYDFYGADRKGENLYGNCLVAVDAATGKHVWHFQTVHHDLWDYDLPAPPNLVTVHQDGKDIDAVAQITKQGFVFVFNRETGKPIFPIEELKVPVSHMPGETAWPTQPFPTKPAPFSRQSMTEADLTHYSDADHEAILKKFRSLRNEGIYTPPDLKGTLELPGTRGGGEWGGAAYDPASSYLYIKSNDAPDIQTITKVDQLDEGGNLTVFDQGKKLYTTYCAGCHGADKNGIEPSYPSLVGLKNRMNRDAALYKISVGGGPMPAFKTILQGKEEAILAYVYDLKQGDSKSNPKEVKSKPAQTKPGAPRYLNTTGYVTFKDPSGNPALRPPWGTLHALNLSTGEYAWQIPLGNDEKRQKKGAPETGQESKGGPIVTAGGLVFISGTADKKLRAIDKKTGKLLWQSTLPGIANATACSYQAKGKQYVALSVGGSDANPAGYIMAFALP